jgi:hypothetical protein
MHRCLARLLDMKRFSPLSISIAFKSVRQGVNSISDRWAWLSRYMRRENDQKCGEKLARLAKMHASEAFVGCDDALEAAIFSDLVDVIKRQENQSDFPEIPENEPRRRVH